MKRSEEEKGKRGMRLAKKGCLIFRENTKSADLSIAARKQGEGEEDKKSLTRAYIESVQRSLELAIYAIREKNKRIYFFFAIRTRARRLDNEGGRGGERGDSREL